ncbi:HAD-IA family hydrolase [Vibrio sp. SS-MA-C1-2]|uniref:HAD-IA family hydrolase n=1 Tax=Vibrio sp. SS-MA-C1-2 TaxID=2908646 RepID=UPI001F454F77|nr:HAD-IA family hydrolase [Vibrio sp. SS-MA-C1-2]UJF17507.1 HAD-IA family hydrolase [Vibrio sp. SS-MA-C1-2]
MQPLIGNIKSPLAKKCVIFDCNGTLNNSEFLCNQSLINVFNRHFNCNLTIEECMEQYNGGNVVDVIFELMHFTGVSAPLEYVEALYRQEREIQFQQHLKPTKGIISLLTRLKEQGIEMCVIAKCDSKNMLENLTLLGLSSFFKNSLFSGDDFNSYKPEPDIIHYAALNMGYSLDECIFIDDSLLGVQTGVNAQVTTVHFHSNPAFKKFDNPEVIEIEEIEHLSQLLI